jgi:cholesterol transport system auxiliary component
VTLSICRETGLRRTLCMQALVPLFLLSTLAGCGGLFHSDARPEQVYFLRAKVTPPGEAARPVFAVSVRVVHPLAAPGLDTVQIMLVQPDRRMSFFSASRWPAAVPDVVETLALQTLRASGSWSSVEDSSSPFPSDYLLQITVRRFEAEYTSGVGAPEVHVVLDCIFGRREGREVVASFAAAGSSVAAANKLSDVVTAFEAATNTALGALSENILEAMRSASGHEGAERRRP